MASTAWTAAYVRAAGVDDCRVLAPYEMQHPAEYELKPGDVAAVSAAKVFVYAGYETMMKSLGAALASDKTVMVKIDTDFVPAHLEKSILAVAAATGTKARAEKNVASLKETLADCSRKLRAAGIGSQVTLAHVFQRDLVELLGARVAGAFGPAPLEAKQIADLTKTGAGLVVDNWHNPASGPLKETLPNARFVELINFPGKDDTRTLEDVLRYNTDRLMEALADR